MYNNCTSPPLTLQYSIYFYSNICTVQFAYLNPNINIFSYSNATDQFIPTFVLKLNNKSHAVLKCLTLVQLRWLTEFKMHKIARCQWNSVKCLAIHFFFNYHLHKVMQSTPCTPLQNIPHLQSTDHISSEVWETFIWQMVPLSPLSCENVSFYINLLMTSTLFLSPAYLSCSSYKWASLVCSQTDRLLRHADAPFIWD